MRIRIATHSDAEAGSTILRRSIKELCQADHGNDPSIIAAWIGNKTPAMWCEWVNRDDASLYVAIEAEEVIGVGMIARNGEIMLNYVSPDARWHGVSKNILAHMEVEARRAGLTRCTLDSTKTARRFYEAAGYRSSGTGIDHEGRMEKSL